MQVQIRDIRSIERAAFAISGATIIAGRNGAGKSTILRTVAALATGITVPDGMKKAEAGALVRVGCSDGGARLFLPNTEGFVAKVDYPKADYESTTDAPKVSVYAAGMAHLDQLEPKKRAEVLQDYIGAGVTKEDFDAAMRDEAFSDKAIEAAWKEIRDPRMGWDGLLKKAKDHGKKLKGKWEEVTGKDYGSKIGGQWVPDGWSEELTGASEENLTKALSDAQAARDAALRNQGADEAEMNRLREAVAANPTQEAVKAVQEAHDSADRDLSAALKERAALPPTAYAPRDPCSCPHCGADVAVRETMPGKYILEVPRALTKEESKKAADAIAGLDGRISRLRGDVASKALAISGLRAAKQNAANASEQLAKLTGATGSADAVDAAKSQVEAAERRLKAFQTKSAADRHHRNIQQNEKLIGLLAPDGLRQRKMQRALSAFNDAVLAPLAAAAGWKPVEIDPALRLRYGGRPVDLCSESETYRARATLQAALAKRDGSALLIMDGADILDREGRGQLVAGLVKAAGVPVLIGMTFSDRKLVPDLAAAGLGASYWVEDGMVNPLAQEAMAA